ncbi:exosortase Q [Ramlibacter sp. PS4R-6]|uniref:exosortase Q n=1 Tax=Ramlibacter sp. PS4R-6 TaxID=3133438 RepID=UPI0030B5176A
MNSSRLYTLPRVLEWSIRIDRAPALLWIACITLALLPTWVWMARRLADGSDDPLGLLAIAALALVLWRHRGRLRVAPRLGWLALATGCALLSAMLAGALPPLATSLVALAALGCVLAAFLPALVAAAPVIGLALLSLPWIASLQFYAGYPLRALTAEASRWLLAPFFAIERMGTALLVDGRLVMVDAPCSGVQMLWLGYFTACMTALWTFRSSGSFLARLPAVSVLVLAGNVVRNTVLVSLEATGGASAAVHDAIGLGVLALVCGAIAWVMADEGERHV